MLQAAENMDMLNSGEDQSRMHPSLRHSGESLTNSQTLRASPYQGKPHNFTRTHCADVQGPGTPPTQVLPRQISELVSERE